MKYNKQYKDRHQLPPPEECSEDPMCFTVNINSEAGTLTVHPYYQALIQRISECADVDMRYEYSKSFKLHMHGWLKVKSKHHILPLYALLNDEKIKNQFTYCLKNTFIKHPDGTMEYDTDAIWQEYCTKQSDIVKPYLKKYNINYRTQINSKKPIGEIYKYISSSEQSYNELTNDLD